MSNEQQPDSGGAIPASGASDVEAAGATDVGLERSTNEDSFLIATLQRAIVVHDASPGARGWFSGERAGTLLVVADGMGGQGGGDVASRTAVNGIAEYLLNVMPWAKERAPEAPNRPSINGVRDQLSSAVLATDERVRMEAAQTGTPRMGTTLTMALLLNLKLYVAHVGDSRCYLLQRGTLSRLTRDHNMAQKFADESSEPIEPPEALQHLLWNSLGAGGENAKPEVSKMSLDPGAVVLLCSDGLNKHVSDQQIELVLRNGKSCAARAAMLVELANRAGGSDNITAVVAEVRR